MKKKRSRIGCLFWVALILLLVVVFLFNRKTISNVIESTGFKRIIAKNEKNLENTQEVTRQAEDKKPQEKPDVSVVEINPTEEKTSTVPAEQESKTLNEKTQPELHENDDKLRNAKLYFIDVDDNGIIHLQAVVRPIRFHDSPLTETLSSLIEGLLPSELNMELISLIPEKTVLKSVRVANGTAFIDFNESFRFNSLGVEGYQAQLKQIVYTATEFPTVDRVQILINGKKYDYLGPEGVFIGKPLTRNSFNDQSAQTG